MAAATGGVLCGWCAQPAAAGWRLPPLPCPALPLTARPPGSLPLHRSIGPNAPAFLTPESLKVIVDAFNLQIVDSKHPEADVAKMLAGQ